MRLSIIFILFSTIRLLSQALTADFAIKSNACLGERLKFTNLSTGATSYEWDFCPGDLDNNPTANILDSSVGAPFKLEFIEVDGQYHAFYTTRGVAKLFRLDFGNNINNIPIETDLGNLGLQNFNPIGWLNVEIVKQENQYVGFIIDFYNRVYRFQLGTDIKNTPFNSEVVYSDGFLSNPVDLVIPDEENNKVAFILNSGDGQLIRLDFVNSFNSSANSIIINTINIGTGGQGGISFVRDQNRWYAVVSTFSGALIKLLFSSGIMELSPLISNINGLPFNPSYRGISIAFDNNNYYIFSQSPTNLYRVNLGTSMDNSPINSTDLGGFNLLNNVWGFSMYKVKSDWLVFSTENSGTNNIYRFNFPQLCFSTAIYSEEFEPIVESINSGPYSVSLVAKDNNGNYASMLRAVSVDNQQSPDISLVIQNICTNSDLFFSIVNESDNIVNYNWSFGDTQTSNLPNPTHQYTSSGDYLVSLQVAADNGCNNYVEKSIKIYDPPDAAFTSPPGLICTNNEFTFINNTLDNFDDNLTYEWLVNDVLESTTRDFNYAFTAGGDQQVKLKTSIPGCSDELTQTLMNVQIGPVVDFSFTGKCEEEEILFTNASSGSISGYQWNFDNGNASTEVNPSEIYSTQGNYDVSLVTTGTNGCASIITKPVTIYSKPQPNFSIDLPPFSCSGSPSQFNDLTTPLTDSNITNRLWSFGDANNGTSTQTNPAYTYNQAGDYQVALGVTSNFGCSNTIQKAITIQPSPTVNFTNTPACLNQATQFTDASGSDVKTWLWSIQSSTYSTKNVVHSFNTTGTQMAMLTVTGNNNCVSQLSKQIVIPVPVATDFTAQSTCATKPSVFTALNAGGADPAVAWNWDFAGQPGSGSPATHVFSKVGSYPVKLSATRQSGCVYSATKSINIIQPPVANFTMNPESGGAPLTVSFTNKSSSATNYVWKFNDANNSTSTDFSPTFVFDLLATYPVELIASNSIGCSDSVKRDVQVVVPQINAVLSELKLTKSADGTFRATVTLENEGNIAIVNPEVYLDLSGLIQVKEMFLGTISPNQSLTRTLTASILPVNLSYACAEVLISGDSNSFDDRECTNLEDEVIFIQPYPNPANDVVYLDWINQDLESMQVIIYNSLGQAVLNQTYSELLPGLNQVQVDVSKLGPGIYFASYTAGTVSQSLRFSVVR